MNNSHIESDVKIFDSSHNYDAGNFNESKDKSLSMIVEILHTCIPSNIEYDLKVSSSYDSIRVDFGKRQANSEYVNIQDSVRKAFKEKGANIIIEFSFSE